MDLSAWLTSKEAASRLGVKYRTLLDFVQRGYLHPEKISRAGVAGGPVSMFDPAEVESLAARRTAAGTAIVPVSAPGPLAKNPEPVNFMQSSVQDAPIQAQPDESKRYPLPIDRKLWLTMEEAVAYTGLGAFYIRAQAQGRRIGPNTAIVYRREDLEEIR